MRRLLLDDIYNVFKHIAVYVEGCVCTDDKDDLGGLTKYGITIRDNPELDIRNLKLADAIEKYNSDWRRYCFHLLWQTDRGIAYLVFNIGVNIGYGTAIKMLQDHFPMLISDGIIGDQTKLAIQNLNFKARTRLIARFAQRVRERYKYLALYRPANRKFLRGWLNRLDNALTIVDENRNFK